MKKSIFIIMFLLFCCSIFLPIYNAQIAYAEDGDSETASKKNIEDEIDKRLDDLQLSEFEIFFQQLEDDYLKSTGTSIKQILKDIVTNKKKFSYDEFVKLFVSIFFKEIVKVLPMVITIIIISILYGVFSGLSSGFTKASTNHIIFIVCYGAIISLLGYTITSSLLTFRHLINSIDNLMGIVFPIMLTLTSALGGVGSATVYQPMMTIMTTLMIKLINVFILPLVIATIVFGIVGNLSESVKLEKLTKTTKSLAEWTLGIVFSLFIAFVTVQGITGTAFDTITIKSAKFALSSYVPILGGHLSDGFDLVLASCVVIKNAVGLFSIVILISIVLLPVIKLLVLIFGLRFAASIIEPVSDKKIADLLYSTSKNLTTLIAIILGFAFLFFIIIMLIIVTCNFGVI